MKASIFQRSSEFLMIGPMDGIGPAELMSPWRLYPLLLQFDAAQNDEPE
jgi:hypothetical protein